MNLILRMLHTRVIDAIQAGQTDRAYQLARVLAHVVQVTK